MTPTTFWCGESNSICLAFQRDFYDGLQYEAVELEMDGRTRVSIQSMEGGMQALSMPTWTGQQQAAGVLAAYRVTQRTRRKSGECYTPLCQLRSQDHHSSSPLFNES